MIATPKFTVETPNISINISFWVYIDRRGDAGSDKVQISLMTDLEDTDNVTLIRDVELSVESAVWLHFDINYNATDGDYYVAFKRLTNAWTHYVFDDVSINMTPAVFTPPGVITDPADNITTTSAMLHKTVTQRTYPITTQGFRYRKGTDMWTNVTTTATAETINGLLPNTMYEFFAYAVPTIGGQVTGDTLTFTTHAVPVVPPTVVTNFPTSVTQTTATLNKTVTPGTEAITAEGFDYRVSGSSTWTSVTNNGNLTGLTANTSYDFYAFATTATDTYYGDTLTFTTPADGVIPPTVVTDVVTNVTQTTVTLNKTVTSGTDPVTEEGWYYKAQADAAWIKVVTNGNLTGLTANTAYEFYAYATAGNTYYGGTLTFTTESESVTPPTVITGEATNVTQTTATLNKVVTPGSEAVTEEGWYYKAQAGTAWTKVVTDGNLTGLTANTSYDFYAFATTASDTFTGDTLDFTTGNNVGYDTANAGMFIIYPNPSNSMATVKVEDLHSSAKVTVTDINGKLIETLTINAGDDKAEFDVANYTDGTYLVRVVADGINRVEKLIVKK
jgi:hypothetical protein